MNTQINKRMNKRMNEWLLEMSVYAAYSATPIQIVKFNQRTAAAV